MNRKDQKPEPLAMGVLLVSDKIHEESTVGRAMRLLRDDLEAHNVTIVVSTTADDGRAAIEFDPHWQAVILDWDLHKDSGHRHAADLLRTLRARNDTMPVFLLAEREDASHIPADVMANADEFIWLLQDTMEFISERIVAAVERYRAQLLPPMFGALVKFSREAEYSWHTPGHTGGTAFLRSPAGRVFHEFFGETLLRADLSISVGDVGSLLDHSGPIGQGERYAAHVFGADRTYYVTNGTSTSNRVVMGACVARGQTVLADRNCHKSVEHGLTLTGAVPVYLVPQRNHLGLIGPIPPATLAGTHTDKKRALAIITNSTYDGLCYNVPRVEALLGHHVDRILFDEAWFAYARFNPLYQNRHAMRGDPAETSRSGPTIFATQSTHKLLAALSQASMIHLREGRAPISHQRFNEAFMMHASTSPQYAIIASNDVSAAMMDGSGGALLTGEAIAEAISFRQTMAKLHTDFLARGEWFFSVWQPSHVKDGARELRFAEAPPALLAEDQTCWLLEPDAAWHGFEGLEPGYAMLDPIKVTIVTPGMLPTGALAETGIPAPLLTSYLAEHGIVAEKTANFSILFLFSIGVTKGKWGSLINAMLDFKRDYDANIPLSRAMPQLAAANPTIYVAMGLRDLAAAMFTAMRGTDVPALLQDAYMTLPRVVSTPAEAYDRLVQGEGQRVPLKELANGIAATALVPYPPGIPLVMPGESLGESDGPVLRYLTALRSFDRQFPGFGHDTHGIDLEAGDYYALRF